MSKKNKQDFFERRWEGAQEKRPKKRVKVGLGSKTRGDDYKLLDYFTRFIAHKMQRHLSPAQYAGWIGKANFDYDLSRLAYRVTLSQSCSTCGEALNYSFLIEEGQLGRPETMNALGHETAELLSKKVRDHRLTCRHEMHPRTPSEPPKPKKRPQIDKPKLDDKYPEW